MKRSTVILLLFAMVAMFGSAVGASAGHCGGSTTGPDPFDSCETNGDVKCGGTEAPGKLLHVATPTSSSNQGVQVCNDDGPVPVFGRVTVFRNSNGDLLIASDGENDFSPSWTRVDVRPGASSCRAQVRRNDWGSYWAGGTTQPATGQQINHCAG